MENILIPRRLEGRAERWKIIIQRQIQQYIKNGCVGDLYLVNTPIEILPDNLIKVGGSLTLNRSKIKSLNKLEYVEENVSLSETKLQDLGNLKHVGGRFLELRGTPISKIYTEEQIRSMVDVKRRVYI